jgi:cytochrome c biogenesis protein CcmG, thiol:disulfide interchange protein DsbE
MSDLQAFNLMFFSRRFTPIIFVMLVAVLSACSNAGNNEATPVLSGHPATTFPMPPLKADAELGWIVSDNERRKLGDFRGKVLVLDFYATWCVPCRQSIPHLIALQKEREGEGLQIVGLNVGGADDRVKVSQFSKELGINYPLGFPDQNLTDFFLSDNQTLPQTFIFGREGQLIKRVIGYEGVAGKEIEDAILSGIGTR